MGAFDLASGLRTAGRVLDQREAAGILESLVQKARSAHRAFVDDHAVIVGVELLRKAELKERLA